MYVVIASYCSLSHGAPLIIPFVKQNKQVVEVSWQNGSALCPFNLPTDEKIKACYEESHWWGRRSGGGFAARSLTLKPIMWNSTFHFQQSGSQTRISAVLNICPLSRKSNVRFGCIRRAFPPTRRFSCEGQRALKYIICTLESIIPSIFPSLFLNRDGLKLSDVSGAAYSQWCKETQQHTLRR